MLSQEIVDCNGIRQAGDVGKMIFSYFIFSRKHYYFEKNDEFNIKDERMAINRRHSSIKTTLQKKYIDFLQVTSI